MVKYVANYNFDKITVIEIERETTSNVYVNKNGKTQRVSKKSIYYQMFDSKEEAKADLSKQIEVKIEIAEKEIQRLTNKLKYIQTL